MTCVNGDGRGSFPPSKLIIIFKSFYARRSLSISRRSLKTALLLKCRGDIRYV